MIRRLKFGTVPTDGIIPLTSLGKAFSTYRLNEEADSQHPEHTEHGAAPKNKATVNSSFLLGVGGCDCQEELYRADVFMLYSLADTPALCVPGVNGFQWSIQIKENRKNTLMAPHANMRSHRAPGNERSLHQNSEAS